MEGKTNIRRLSDKAEQLDIELRCLLGTLEIVHLGMLAMYRADDDISNFELSLLHTIKTSISNLCNIDIKELLTYIEELESSDSVVSKKTTRRVIMNDWNCEKISLAYFEEKYKRSKILDAVAKEIETGDVDKDKMMALCKLAEERSKNIKKEIDNEKVGSFKLIAEVAKKFAEETDLNLEIFVNEPSEDVAIGNIIFIGDNLYIGRIINGSLKIMLDILMRDAEDIWVKTDKIEIDEEEVPVFIMELQYKLYKEVLVL